MFADSRSRWALREYFLMDRRVWGAIILFTVFFGCGK